MLMSASTNDRADDRRAAVRQQPRHAGGAGQRHQRHLRRPRTAATSPSPRGRFARRRSTTSSAATSTASRTSERAGANLGLYSITFNNRLDDDLAALEALSRSFAKRPSARAFATSSKSSIPTRPRACRADTTPQFINDTIARTLAGVAQAGRPVFLKIVYHGPQAMEELVAYDPHLVVGILGGGAGTTYDAFKLLAEAQKYGARAALFGRKINNAEYQLAFVEFLRLIVDGEISPEEAVRAYHGVLEQLKIKPQRSLARRPAAAKRRDELRRRSTVERAGGRAASVMAVLRRPRFSQNRPPATIAAAAATTPRRASATTSRP